MTISPVLGQFGERLQDNWVWLMGLWFMVEPLADSLFDGYRAWADRYISRRVRSRVSWAVAIFTAFVACFLAFQDQYNATVKANNTLNLVISERNVVIGERDEARRQLLASIKPDEIQPDYIDGLKRLGTTQLRSRITDFSQELYEYQNSLNVRHAEQMNGYDKRFSQAKTEDDKNNIWQERINAMSSTRIDDQRDFQIKFRSRALALRDEVARRLLIDKSMFIRDPRFTPLDFGMLAGVSPVTMIADALNELAQRLP